MKKRKSIMMLLLITALLIGILSACKNRRETDKESINDVKGNAENKIEKDVTDAGKDSFKPFIDLNQEQIVEAMAPGWNLGNQLEAVVNKIPGETNWGNPVITEELILAVKAAGFQSIRIPVSYFSYIGDAPNYIIDEKWLDRIQEVVDYVVKNDIYAVVNMHGDGYHTIDGGWLLVDAEDQETIKAKYKAVWQQVAVRFKDYDHHLIFESMNEVFDGNYNGPKSEFYKNLNAYNQIFMDTVRQSGGNNDMRWLLVPGWNTDIEFTAYEHGFKIPADNYLSAKVPDGEPRTMISVHYYGPWDFCGGESKEITQWGEIAKDKSKVSTHSGQSFMASQFKLLFERFTSNGYPVIIGEYGAIDKSDFEPDSAYYRAYFVRKVAENSIRYGAIPMYWDNGHNGRYGFALFDRKSKTVTQQEIIDAMMEVYYGSSVEGTAIGITLDQTELTMEIGDEGIMLNAKLTPTDSTDRIKWASGDETVATITDNGIVRPQLPGTAIVKASLPNGTEVECKVNVVASRNVRVMLYAIETSAWSTISSDTYAEISPEGGTYTLSLTGSTELLSKIGALFIKDMQVQSNLVKTSVIKSAKVTITSFQFNGVELTPVNTGSEEMINDSQALDYAILNQWVPDGNKVKEVTKENSGSYEFIGIEYKDSNTVEITFTITDVVMQ